MVLLISCQKNTSNNINQIENTTAEAHFQLLDSNETGVDFINVFDESQLTNPYNYFNLYSGAGVSIGDINNDNLPDIFLAGNMVNAKLFLNKGNMTFEDITLQSGIKTTGWCTATTMADINNDGLLDIYVCRAYDDNPKMRENLAFINQGSNNFVEQAQALGINDENYSIGCSFFDYDLDGDLDLITGNHPRYALLPAKIHYDYWRSPVKEFSNRLFRNDGNKFTDVTEEAGVLSYGHTLGLSTSDYNVDGYPDIFITVDHAEPDYIFENNGDGTFKNVVSTVVGQTSKSSMGIDVGDVNHDIFPDFFVSEMLSEDHFREKVHMDMTNIDRFHFFVDSMGYKYYQMHNFLYLNNGNNSFSDIAQMADVHKSDWSWSNLFMDFDNDGWQDIFVSNGYYKHIFQKDIKKQLDKGMHALGNDMAAKNKLAHDFVSQLDIDPIPNYLFKNNGDLTFTKYSEQAGLSQATISTGASYGDLDNDGDLDLIISNVGDAAMIYENKSAGNNYMKVKAKGTKDMNILGSKVYLTINGSTQSREILTTRGFISSSEPLAHFGMGSISNADAVSIIWPDGKYQTITKPDANQTIVFDYENAKNGYPGHLETPKALVQMKKAKDIGIDFFHHENIFRDFDIQILLPHRQSEYGPFIAVADVNGDGLEDVYFPAPHQQMGRLYLQKANGKFQYKKQNAFFEDRNYEDGKASFVDLDEDGDLDLLVSSTGYEFKADSPLYKPRIYINDGHANFSKSDKINGYASSASCIKTADFDGDGDVDIFIGGRLRPHAYPNPGNSGLLINDGNGNFTNKIQELAPGLEKAGMVHDAVWTDLDEDQDLDLIVVGEWMPVSVWMNENNQLVNRTEQYFEKPLVGWWNTIEVQDLNNDGRQEFIVGNLGLNYKYKASHEKPFTVYTKDIDTNGSCDIVLGTYYGDKLFPVRGKTCSTQQLPEFEKVYKSYTEYASLELEDLYGPRLEGATKYEVNEFASVILELNDGQFRSQRLPARAQIAPVNGIVNIDLNKDGLMDIIVAGNLYQSEIETGRADSGTGVVLINKGNLNFEALDVVSSGLYMPGDVKSLETININGETALIAGVNGSAPLLAILDDKNI